MSNEQKQMKRNLTYVGLGLLGLGAVFAVTMNNQNDNMDSKIPKSEIRKSSQKMSEEEEKSLLETFSTLVNEAENTIEVEKFVDENISKVSANGANKLVDGLLYVMEVKTLDFKPKIFPFEQDFESIEKDMEIDLSEDLIIEVSSIENLSLKGLLSDIYSNKCLVFKNSNGYTVVSNQPAVLEKYNEYISDELRMMVEFTTESDRVPFYSDSSSSFDMELVAKRIITLEESIKKYPESMYMATMEGTRDYYYQVFFGTNNSFLVDLDDNILDEIVTEYNMAIEEYPDSELASKIKQVLELLAENDNKVNDVVYQQLLEITNIKASDFEVDISETELFTEEDDTGSSDESDEEAINQ